MADKPGAELGSFLRARREALRPADVGLVAGGRRRTPGLRREEVALLANLSVNYYERLERSRDSNPSETVLANLARALRLTADEHDYLYYLADQAAPVSHPPGVHVEPSMMFLLDTLTTVPAHVMDDLTTVLAQNPLSHALFGTYAEAGGRYANVAWRWFTDPDTRTLTVPEEHEAISRRYAADLRAAVARRGRDRIADQLIADLKDASTEFTRYWDGMHVEVLRSIPKTFIHPRTGRLDIQRDVLLSTSTSHRLVIFRPRPGSPTAENLDFLRVLGQQTFNE
jgi:transcriptional regulator with XRE-family HTH domain